MTLLFQFRRGGRGEEGRGEVRRGDNLNFIGILKFFSL